MDDFEKRFLEQLKGSKITKIKRFKNGKLQFVVLHEKYRELDERLTMQSASDEFYQELLKLEVSDNTNQK